MDEKPYIFGITAGIYETSYIAVAHRNRGLLKVIHEISKHDFLISAIEKLSKQYPVSDIRVDGCHTGMCDHLMDIGYHVTPYMITPGSRARLMEQSGWLIPDDIPENAKLAAAIALNPIPIFKFE